MAGRISIDNLSNSLKNIIEQNGLTEAQVIELIKNNTGDISQLNTSNKSSLVAAINELFQSANNGKELIASAIGEPLSSNDTFSAMSNDINGLLSTFKTNMMNAGVAVESSDKFKSLINKIKGLTEGEGNKGIQYTEGIFGQNSLTKSQEFTLELNFVPSLFFIGPLSVNDHYDGTFVSNIYVSNLYQVDVNNPHYTGESGHIIFSINNLSQNGLLFNISNPGVWESSVVGDFKWYAIGIGEEDTTLRDSLASILQEEGVNVTEEDDMASLIGKVDSEFTKDNTIISELEDDIENTRSTLAGLMQEGGYDINGNDTIDDLLDLLIVSGIKSDEIKQISSGNAYSMLLTTDGSLYATGSGSDGRTGLGDTVKRMAFVNVLDDVVQVACGNNYTLVVKNDGSLWGCGFNENGQLGLSGTADRLTFTEITTGVKQVACGYSHSVILKTDGTVWACGGNTYGQLGLGNTTNKTTFTKVTTNVSNVKEIYCGENHTVMLKTDGSLYSCGRNGSGQLGLGTSDDNAHVTFTKITTNVNNDVKQVACGKTNVFILKNDGSVWACGSNGAGGLGLCTEVETINSTFIKIPKSF